MNGNPYLSRRRFIHLTAVLGSAVVLGACQRDAVQFNSVDVTGADYGTSLKLLRDPSGKAGDVADFKGKVLAVFFGFTQCPDVCPTALAKLKDVKSRLGKEGENLAVVFVTVDPERDSPALLAQYIAAFDSTFVPLHGDSTALQTVTKDFKVFFEKAGDIPSGRYTVNHTTGIYFFDPAGRVRLFARHEETAERILADVRLLLQGR